MSVFSDALAKARAAKTTAEQPTEQTTKTEDNGPWSTQPVAPEPPVQNQQPASFSQDWFMQQVAGKPYNQQTLLDLESSGALASVGSRLTPANAQGERTKIYDPNTGQWVRVGFGEGRPVWIPQGDGTSSGGGWPQIQFQKPPEDPRMTDLINLLTNRSKQSLNIDAANDPMIRQQADPYSAQVERQKRDYLADLAEQSGPLANLRGETRLANERAGQAKGLFESQLVGRELESRRAEIQDALHQWGSLLSGEQSLALQRELSYLNDATQRLGLGLQNDQFMRDLGLRAEDRYNYWDAVRSGALD